MELNINAFDLGLNFNNFDPDSIDVEETINAVMILDVSPSMMENNAITDLTTIFNELVEEFKQSHFRDRLFFSIIEFSSDVKVKTGFQPITSLQPMQFTANQRGLTALYDATLAGLKNAMDYRERLENSGVLCKTLLFVITDGDDNASKTNPHEVKNAIQTILKDEKNKFTFSSMLLGVGNDASFRKAKDDMGIQYMPETHEKNAKGIRKLINIISSSVSSTANGSTNISF